MDDLQAAASLKDFVESNLQNVEVKDEHKVIGDYNSYFLYHFFNDLGLHTFPCTVTKHPMEHPF